MALDDVGGMATSSGMRGYLPALGLSWLYGRGGGGRGAGGGGGVTPRRELENQTIALQNREQIGINAQGQSLNQQVDAHSRMQGLTLGNAGVQSAAGGRSGLRGVTGPLASVQFANLAAGTPMSGQTVIGGGRMDFGNPQHAASPSGPQMMGMPGTPARRHTRVAALPQGGPVGGYRQTRWSPNDDDSNIIDAVIIPNERKQSRTGGQSAGTTALPSRRTPLAIEGPSNTTPAVAGTKPPLELNAGPIGKPWKLANPYDELKSGK
jgi:hypothetical protein